MMKWFIAVGVLTSAHRKAGETKKDTGSLSSNMTLESNGDRSTQGPDLASISIAEYKSPYPWPDGQGIDLPFFEPLNSFEENQ
jgi:hypothetical protein